MRRVRRFVSRHDGWTQCLVVLAAVGAYELLRLAARPDWSLAISHAHQVAAWERRAHIAWEASLQRAFLHLPWLVDALNVFYLGGNFLLTGAFFVWLYRRSRSSFGRYRNAFLLATAVSLLVEFRYPTAPPRLAAIGVEDTLRSLLGIDIGSSAGAGLTDPVAAFPSLHAGWALGVGIGVFGNATSRLAKGAGIAYPLVVTVTVIVTGNHFLVDALSGMAIVGGALALVHAAGRLEVVDSRVRRGVEQSGSSPGS